MDRLSDMASFVNQLTVDLKAETIIALLQTDSLKAKDILVAFNGQHKRTYAKDVSLAKVTEFENGERALSLRLNRDGIYDALPEAIFHTFSDESSVGGDDMARDSMKLKNEEKETRAFFQPFENQIFSQLANLAAKENTLFKNVYSRVLHGLIPNFWNINREIPVDYSDRLIRLIPMAYQIVGDRELTTEAFEFILKEQVEINFQTSQDISNQNVMPVSAGPGLGECQLGIDLYSGDSPEIPLGVIEVSIGPLCQLDVTSYLDGGWLKILLDTMHSYFLPMEAEVTTTLLPGIDKQEFLLDEPGSEMVTFLGFNTVL